MVGKNERDGRDGGRGRRQEWSATSQYKPGGFGLTSEGSPVLRRTVEFAKMGVRQKSISKEFSNCFSEEVYAKRRGKGFARFIVRGFANLFGELGFTR